MSRYVGFDGSWKLNDKLTLTANAGTSNGQTLSQTSPSCTSRPSMPASVCGARQGAVLRLHPALDGSGLIFSVPSTIVRQGELGPVDGEYQLDAGLLRSLFGLRGAEHKRCHTDATLNQGPAAPLARLIAVAPFAWSQPSALRNATGKDDPANSPFASLPALSSSFLATMAPASGNGFPTQIGFIPADAGCPQRQVHQPRPHRLAACRQ